MTVRPWYLEASAEISEDGMYRYGLLRRLTRGERTVLFVGLNPSTADAQTDDPTIRRCVGFARLWGYDLMLVGNIYAYRSTNPNGLLGVEDPVGPGNVAALKSMIQKADRIVAAWGRHRLTCFAQTYAGWVLSLPTTGHLGRNKDGTPKHPLYLPSATKFSLANGC